MTIHARLSVPFLAFIAAGCLDELPTSEQQSLVEADEESSGRPLMDGEERIGGEHVATLPTFGTSRLIFIGHGEGRDETVSIVGATAPGTPEVLALRELIGASPLEVFNAASRPGTPFPETIVRLYGREATLGEQGWALDRLEEAGPLETGFCNNTHFTAAVESYGYDDYGAIRLDQVPGVDADNVWDPYEDCFDTTWVGGKCPDFHRYHRTYEDIDAYYGRVAVCDLDFHPTVYGNWGSWSHPGPTIQFWARSPAASKYTLLYQHDVYADEIGAAYKMHHEATNHDNRIWIKEAEANDSFDIGTAGEDF